MKKILVFLLFLFTYTSAFAAQIDNVVFFGDSLSDNGNLYKLLLHVMPKSPPYYEGRFSNGPTWAEQLATYLAARYNASASNYAVGGATAIYHPPSDKFVTLVTLTMELDKYYLDALFKDKSHTLFVIWIGDNDYMFEQNVDPNAGTSKVITTVLDGIQELYDRGARHFLILNLADASRTPFIRQTGSPEKLHHLVLLHNQKLATSVQSFAHQHPDVKVNYFNINSIFDELIENPEKINQEYQINITNTMDACWTGGFFLRTPIDKFNLKQELAMTLNKQTSAAAMAQYIAQVPELAYTYSMGKSLDNNNLPCANPDTYLFWDDIHPTAVVHAVIAKMIEEAVGDDI